ncbi:FAD-dependent oxidoreductase [Deinococcus radiopugnans]|uniref:NAD(P)/FAD-dependent oxidoreductase n=1 Tax=Deinococcus radiopugnans TaxID=57497 RepID=UPI00361C5C9E
MTTAAGTTAAGLRQIQAERVILATGATERFLPFDGWTLPGVVGAGGLQAMSKSGLDVRGQRVVVAGSGPLLLAVAAGLRQKGARVLAVAEQAGWPGVAAFGMAAARLPGKSREALALAAGLLGVPYWADCAVVRASGADQLQSVTLRRGRRELTLDCDYLAVGFGLVPDTRVAALLGCPWMTWARCGSMRGRRRACPVSTPLERSAASAAWTAPCWKASWPGAPPAVRSSVCTMRRAAPRFSAASRSRWSAPSPCARPFCPCRPPKPSSAAARTCGTATCAGSPIGRRPNSRPVAAWALVRAGSAAPRATPCMAGALRACAPRWCRCRWPSCWTNPPPSAHRKTWMVFDA